jgi:hypothetical protein
MAAKKNAPAMDYIVDYLKKDKNASYAEIAEGANKRGHTIFPIMYGRAKAMLGLVPVAPRGQGKKGGNAAATATVPASAARGPGRPPIKRGPGRPPKSAASVAAAGSLDAVIQALKDGDRERDRFRRALEQIRGILETLV